MSLMNAAGCCCCATPICNCLPSSYQMTFQSFTVHLVLNGNPLNYTVPAQTVTAYKCCFSYDSGDGYGVQNRIVYRPSLINIGTYYPSIPLYFAIHFGVDTNYATQYNPCVVQVEFVIFSPNYHTNTSSFCFNTPSVINANTACHFVGTNETCYDPDGNLFSNTFMQGAILSYFDDCACPTYDANDICCGYNPYTIHDINGDYGFSQDNRCNLINVNKGHTPPGYVLYFYLNTTVSVVFVLS